MKEQVISFETAKLAKEKGFNWYVNSVYTLDNKFDDYNVGSNNQFEGWYSAPSQSLLQRWLRENKNLCVLVDLLYSEEDFTPFYDFKISKTNKLSTLSTSFMQHNSYEDALEKGLYEALMML